MPSMGKADGPHGMIKKLAALVVCLALAYMPMIAQGQGVDLSKTPFLKVEQKAGYAVLYDYAWHVPRAVIYTLEPGKDGDIKRLGSFHAEEGTALPSWLEKSGYDLGHMKPAEDSDSSDVEMLDSFSMLNICPQEPSLNRGDWKELEMKLRKDAEKEAVLIICGPIFASTHPKMIADGQLVVPDAFYKVAYPARGPPKAWIFPNVKGENKTPDAYITTLYAVSIRTGLYFKSDIRK